MVARNPKIIYNESFGIVSRIPVNCKHCHKKLEKVSMYNDIAMDEVMMINPQTGKDERVYTELDNGKRVVKHRFRETNSFMDRYNYLLRCTNCAVHYEIMLSKKIIRTNKKYKKYKQVVQVF